jgi:hypothetical protein
MDRTSIIIERKSTHTFLSNIAFNKLYYKLYDSIINRTTDIDENVVIFLICQTARQVGFDGYFDEFYMDVSRRRHIYVKQILSNFETAYLSFETFSSKLYKFIYGLKKNNREILFNSMLHTFNLDNYIASIFVEGNEELKNKFIAVCNLILSQHQPIICRQIVPIDY